jgi:hypothetical protein
VFLLGAILGGCVFVGEMSEGGGTPSVGRLVFAASVFYWPGNSGASRRLRMPGNTVGIGTETLSSGSARFHSVSGKRGRMPTVPFDSLASHVETAGATGE